MQLPLSARARLAGFTLAEVAVAMAILALALGVLYEGFGWSLRRTGTLERREVAWLTAQSLLAQIRGREVLRTGTEQGTTADGLKWQLHISVRGAPAEEYRRLKAFEVTVEVSWGDRAAQRVRLQSVEAGRIAS